MIFGNGIVEIGNWRRERENCLNKKNIVYLFLFFSSFFWLVLCVCHVPSLYCKWRVNQPITSPLYLILILCLEYIHWSFPIKSHIDITPKSISEILFCLFISPLRNKRQVPLSFYFSSLIEGLHLLTKYPWPKQFGLCVCHVLSFRIVKVSYETNNDRFKYN